MTVVIAYVPDDTGYLAVTEGAREASWRQTDVVVVNVVDRMIGHSAPTAADEKQLDAIDEYLTGTGVPHAVRVVEHDSGTVADELLAVVEETSADLVVVGLKRRSAVAKAVLGSTAQRVLIGAPCPVLAVRADDM